MRAIDFEAVAAARAWIGTPYVHQASCQGAGADCLGLIRGVWRSLFGQEPEPVPPYSPDWSELGEEELLWSAARRHLVPDTGEVAAGRVLLFRMRDYRVAKHLGLASVRAGQTSFVHAYSGHGVVESALTDAWRRRLVAQFALPERHE